MLTLSGLNASYEGSQILRNVSMVVPQRQVVTLMGRNGVGKTTTLKCVVGLLTPLSGDVRLGDLPLNGLRPDERARLGLGYVPQGRDIFPNLTVWENMQVGPLARGTRPADEMTRVLDLFPMLKEMLKRKGGILSGGQQQQLAIARALLTAPKVLVLDEPTEGIQPNIIDLIGETLLKLKKEGQMSILLVEQYLDFCLSVADRFYVMDRGAIAAEGPISNLDQNVVRQYLTV